MVSQLYSLFRKHIARQNAFSTSIAVAMSGGIDSSVTAYLLKQQGCRAEIYGYHTHILTPIRVRCCRSIHEKLGPIR